MAVDRAAVDRVLAEGPGRFLGRLFVEPDLERERFRGWRVVRFHGKGLQPGDIVLRVNGRNLERVEHAYEVWERLRVADEIVVEILRNGEPLTLRFPILEPIERAVGRPQRSRPSGR